MLPAKQWQIFLRNSSTLGLPSGFATYLRHNVEEEDKQQSCNTSSRPQVFDVHFQSYISHSTTLLRYSLHLLYLFGQRWINGVSPSVWDDVAPVQCQYLSKTQHNQHTGKLSPSFTECTDAVETIEFSDKVRLLEGRSWEGCCSSSSFSRDVKSTPDCCNSAYVPFATMWP